MAENKGTSAAAKKQPRNDREIADATGVTEQRRRAVASQREGATKARRFKNPVPGEPDIIIGETVEEVRARVAKERAESEPTEYMKSVLPSAAELADDAAAAAEK